MIKRLKTLEQIKREWGNYNFIEDKYKAIRFYNSQGMVAHITFPMKKYFGGNVDVKKAKDSYYDWLLDNSSNEGIWHFRDDWFEDFKLEDSLFEI